MVTEPTSTVMSIKVLTTKDENLPFFSYTITSARVGEVAEEPNNPSEAAGF